MDLNQITGYILAVFVGISLGLMGSGGSILTVPILVYIMGVSPVLATAYSLFIVGMTALTGSIKNAFEGKIDFKKAVAFGIPSVISVFLTRIYFVPKIPETLFIGNFELKKSVLIMSLFAVFMMAASVSMLRATAPGNPDHHKKNNYWLIFLLGISIGIIAGLVGAGGGFLIIPSLVILMETPMRKAIGTSLSIVAVQSLIGFSGDLLSNQEINWKFLLIFTAFAILGIFIGIMLNKKIPGEKLKKGFGWFVLLMGIYIISKELLHLVK